MKLKKISLSKTQLLVVLALAVAAVIFILVVVRRPQSPAEIVVARIGDQVITLEEFRENYEFGLPQLKLGSTPVERKRSYLNFMINERLLALEGYSLGFGNSPMVRYSEEALTNELVVESLLDVEVKSKITVSEDEIRQAINRSAVSFKYRFWAEPTPERAWEVVTQMRDRGYAAVVNDKIRQNPELMNVDPKKLETEYIGWLDTPPAILDAIQNLPIGDISNPVLIDGAYYIFQVEDVRREAVLENDYMSKAPTIRKMIVGRKMHDETTKYVSGFVTPKNVVTKGPMFRLLSDAMEEWRRSDPESSVPFASAVVNAGPSQPAMAALKERLDQPLVTYNGGTITVRDAAPLLKVPELKKTPDSTQVFRTTLNKEVALAARDHLLAQEGRRRNLQELPSVRKQVQEWRDKWVYQETRGHFVGGLMPDEEQAKAFFELNKARFKTSKDQQLDYAGYANIARQGVVVAEGQAILQHHVDSLKALYPVTVNYAAIDTLTTVEFAKNRWASVQLFKGGTNRLAVPIVDATWGFGYILPSPEKRVK